MDKILSKKSDKKGGSREAEKPAAKISKENLSEHLKRDLTKTLQSEQVGYNFANSIGITVEHGEEMITVILFGTLNLFFHKQLVQSIAQKWQKSHRNLPLRIENEIAVL